MSNTVASITIVWHWLMFYHNFEQRRTKLDRIFDYDQSRARHVTTKYALYVQMFSIEREKK